MYPLRSLIVVVRSCHVSFTLTLIHYKDDLCSYLCAQERAFIKPDIFPFRKVFRRFDKPNARGRLAM